MIKWLLALLLLCLLGRSSLNAQSAAAVFLQKDSTTENGYHAVFIEHDRTSRHHDRITFSAQHIRDAAKQLKALSPKIKPRPVLLPASLPRNWVPLHSYRDSYYVYQPCDGISLSEVNLSSTAILQLREPYEEGSGHYLQSLRKIGSNGFELTYSNAYDSGSLRIIMVDSKRHIAVFRYNCGDGNCEDFLMVDAAYVRRFPIIVNECRDNKAREFEFDAVDFDALLR